MDSPRRILVVRHGERCDFSFSQHVKNLNFFTCYFTGIDWMKRAFDSNGKYRAFDLNLPRLVPKRKDGYQKFANDAPLTEMGYLQAKLTGRSLLESGIKVDHIFCSPALRCIQTAVGLLRGMNCSKLKINIEPGLFEWTQWCRSGLPSWMHATELDEIMYPVNPLYTPYLRPEDLSMKETVADYYDRSHKVVREVLKKYKGTVLFVAHSASLDTLTRRLCGRQPRNEQEFLFILQQTPYLACAMAKENSNNTWSLCPPPTRPLTHSANHSYNPQ
uniref:Protein UBASH3A-like protein n=1 Tax=Syphacia muris TaxID=451379 RepID=A0A0N5ADL7_9BILA